MSPILFINLRQLGYLCKGVNTVGEVEISIEKNFIQLAGLTKIGKIHTLGILKLAGRDISVADSHKLVEISKTG